MSSQNNTGRKDDHGKAKWGLMDFTLLSEMADVLTVGAKKYGDVNYKLVDRSRYLDAFGRHWAAYMSGEMNDPEDGISHLAHIMANIQFIAYHDRMRIQNERNMEVNKIPPYFPFNGPISDYPYVGPINVMADSGHGVIHCHNWNVSCSDVPGSGSISTTNENQNLKTNKT